MASEAISSEGVTADEAIKLLDFAEHAAKVRNMNELASDMLPAVAEIAHSEKALLYICDPGLLEPCLFQHGCGTESMDANEIKSRLADHFEQITNSSDEAPIELPAPEVRSIGIDHLFPLRTGKTCSGILGVGINSGSGTNGNGLFTRALRILATSAARLAERERCDRNVRHLNTYLTVSSMLAQPLGLHELLETILYACLDAASAEEASILLLQEDKTKFCFYQVEGPSKPVLMGITFPADKGIAGSILQSQQSEIINDVQNDPRFYGKIDSDSGFKTRNMIAIPLTAGEERIGVLEVLNKRNGLAFTQEEHTFLVSVAEEIAFAIRNAKVFEYVVESYCKQRQGMSSCKGCKRPLGSWTPCVKYREAVV